MKIAKSKTYADYQWHGQNKAIEINTDLKWQDENFKIYTDH